MLTRSAASALCSSGGRGRVGRRFVPSTGRIARGQLNHRLYRRPKRTLERTVRGPYDDSFSNRFQDEARIVARLEHPNIVPIYRFGIDEGMPWMAMRLLNGGTLAKRLQHRSLEPTEVIAVLKGAAAALDHAHAHGVIHRDVKPSNIVFDEADHLYLTDFGIAAIILEATMRATGLAAVSGSGSPPYMSPEQVRAARSMDDRTSTDSASSHTRW